MPGHQLDSSQEFLALRVLRSVLPGFATLDVAGGSHIDASVADSSTWMITLNDHGLLAVTVIVTATPSALAWS